LLLGIYYKGNIGDSNFDKIFKSLVVCGKTCT